MKALEKLRCDIKMLLDDIKSFTFLNLTSVRKT